MVRPATAAPAGTARPGEQGLGYFPAIDGLRAVAILSVLVYHLRPAWLPGGFVGVDVFFVVSGFVVTASLVHLRFHRIGDLLAHFYARRIVRIVPALVAMLVPTALVTILFVPTSNFLFEARSTALSASIGASNIYLALSGSSYFDPRQELNPFLHTWTLGVEEQFYLLFPFFFYFCQRIVDDPRQSRRAATAIAIVSALSLLLAWRLAVRQPPLGFYLMPARFWELGSGMLLCLTLSSWRPRIAALPAWAAAVAGAGLVAALALVLALAPAGLPLRHLLLAVAATIGLIALICAHPGVPVVKALGRAPPVFVGRISYSLYLWHWPVFVLFRWTVGLETVLHASLATALAFLLAILSYFLVEQPLRRGHRMVKWPRRRVLGLGATAVVGAAAVSAMLFLFAPSLSLSDFHRRAVAEQPSSAGRCALREARRSIGGGQVDSWTPLCPKRGDGGRLFLLGDSHVRTYPWSLRRYAGEAAVPVLAYSRDGCDFPSLSVPMTRRSWCTDYYDRALDELLRELKPGDVLLMPSLHLPRLGRQWRGLPHNERVRRGLERAGAFPEAQAALRRLAATGATLVIEAPGPLFPSSPVRCSDWFNRRNPACAEGLAVGRAELVEMRRPALEAMNRLAASVPNLRIWDPFPVLCPGDPCTAFRGDRALYWDQDHMSPVGRQFLYPHFLRAVAPAARAP